jgi:hypothetical protein
MDDSPLSGTTDSVRPWTIKSMPTEVRNRVVAAARDEGITASQWLERVIRDRVAAGPAQHHSGPIVPSGGNAGLDTHAISAAVQTMQEARAMAEAAGVSVPQSLARTAFALVRQATRQARGLPPPAPRRRLSGPGSESAARLATDESEN